MININLLQGDCLNSMKELADNSIDSIVTDPPYGLSFMGKKWDYDVPSVEIWKECLRVLKPGGHLLSFGGTRTYHRMTVNIEDAGFEIRDQIMWIYGSGFPKSHNIKEGDFKGWGTALKPANEPICVARKPLEKGLTIAENVLKYGTGAINVDACRIEGSVPSTIQGQSSKQGEIYGADQRDKKEFHGHSQGRWPANIIFDEQAAEMLDEQSGMAKPKAARTGKSGGVNPAFMSKEVGDNEHQESDGYWPAESGGGASRFFYVAKASKRERNAGLEGMPEKVVSVWGGDEDDLTEGKKSTIPRQNHHPTVKPIKLMEYLIKLVTPPKGTVLDPFMGSGSTGVAVNQLGFKFVGCEMNEEYFEIAKKRIG